MRWLVAFFALALVGCGSAQTGAVRIDPALSTLVPPDTRLLAGVKMEDLKGTPLYKKWVAGRPLPGLDDLARDTGLDPRRDLWEVLVVSDGSRSAMLARGRFSPDGFEPELKRPGIQRTPYKGYTLIGNDQGAVVFVNTTTAVAGSAAAVRAVIDQRGRSSGVPVALQPLIKSIPPGNQLWLAAAGPFAQLRQSVPQSGNLANLPKILSMLDSVVAAADVRAGVKAFATGVSKTDQDAQSLSDALRGLVGLGRLTVPQDQPDLLRVYDGMRVSQQQRTVRLDAAIPADLLDTLIGRFSPESRPSRRP